MRNHIAIIRHRFQFYRHNGINFRPIVWRKHLDIVGCKARHHTTFGRPLEQHFGSFANVSQAEISIQTATKLFKSLNSLGRHLWRHLIGHQNCRRIRSLREWEDMQLCGCQLLQKVVCRLEILLCFTRESDNHINTNKGIGHQLTHRFNSIGVTRCGIATSHTR